MFSLEGMSNAGFVHLHVHSEYSLLDGAARIADLASEAAAHGMPALALTDHGNLFGAIEFYKECREQGVKPIIGCEVYLAPGSRLERKALSAKDTATHLLLLAKDETGYRNLIQLVTAGHLEGFYYKPRVDKELLAKHAKGLICTSACLKGEVAQAILQDQPKLAEKSIDDFVQIFGKEDFYLEIADHGVAAQKLVNQALARYSKSLGLKLVATNDVHYVKKEHAAAHDVLLCIQTGSHLSDEKRMRYPAPEFYFKSPTEMAAIFADHPQALRETLAIAEKCDLKIEMGKNRFPAYTPPEGLGREQYLRNLCQKGLAERYGARAQDAELKQRLEYELGVIEKTGFTSYFLIVWDFIDFAKKRGIPVGPGRGSAAGSMIAYALGITDLDPLQYGLFFERFLNPERVTPPDIDIDFCYNGRGEVINYVRSKYGDRAVAQIVTFGTLGAKMAVRDVGRVLGLSYGEADRLAKMIPFDPKMTLKKALNDNPEFKRAYDEEETTRQVLDYALTLEGISRQSGVHAAGVVIADGDLTDLVPLTRDEDGGVVTQYAMDPLGDVGMLKMDFLGLKTLTVIEDCVKLIAQTTGKSLRIEDIPLDDAGAYDLLCRAQNVGLFQVESAGMCDLCRRMQPRNIEDVIALVALFRPGPMENIPAYADRKLGRVPIEYEHPLLEPILKDTYGVMIYQEQVMQAANALAGYTLGQADLLRRAMGKKKPEEMAKQSELFIEGCEKKNNIPAKKAREIFDTLARFAGYGFNKAHSACYGLLAYRTAYLKSNYPVEFFTALLSNDLDNTDKIAQFVAEAKAIGIEILAPCINASRVLFTVEDNQGKQAIRYGLAAIKNVGQAAVETMVASRNKEGAFSSLENFCNRVEARAINKKLVESLVKAGAFDSLGETRSSLFGRVDGALAHAGAAARERESGQASLLDLLGPLDQAKRTQASIQAAPEWPVSERLAAEKELLGFYLTGHPLDEYRAELAALQLSTINGLAQVETDATTRIAGLISKMEVRITQKDKRPWARMTLEDPSGSVEILIFPDTYAGIERGLVPGTVASISGDVDRRDGQTKLRAREVLTLEQARARFYRSLMLHIPMENWDSTRWSALRDLVQANPGPLPVHLHCDGNGKGSLQLELPEILRVSVSREFLLACEPLIQPGRVCITASRQLPKPEPKRWAKAAANKG